MKLTCVAMPPVTAMMGTLAAAAFCRVDGESVGWSGVTMVLAGLDGLVVEAGVVHQRRSLTAVSLN